MKKSQKNYSLYIRTSSNKEAYEREYFYSLRIEDFTGEFADIAFRNWFDDSEELLDYLFQRLKNGDLKEAIKENFGRNYKIICRSVEQPNGKKVTIKIKKYSFKDRFLKKPHQKYCI